MANRLAALIRKGETGDNYNVVWGGIARHHRPPKAPTQMTIGEVLDWQDSIDPHYLSEAAGAYQFMEDTLRRIYRPAGFTRNTVFDEDVQDELARFLMRERGLDDFLRGDITAVKFANNLAREWASLPLVSGPKRGRSYYDGDGLNKAHIKPQALLDAIASLKTARPQSPWLSLLRGLWGFLLSFWRK